MPSQAASDKRDRTGTLLFYAVMVPIFVVTVVTAWELSTGIVSPRHSLMYEMDAVGLLFAIAISVISYFILYPFSGSIFSRLISFFVCVLAFAFLAGMFLPILVE